MDLTEASTQSIVDELRDRMVGMTPYFRAELFESLLDGMRYIPAEIVQESPVRSSGRVMDDDDALRDE